MDSEKLYDYCPSETSSEETDHHHHHQPEKSSDENSGGGSGGGGRFYECTYCKRGFTNAQALGGHMNIHRKEKAKTKPKTKKGSVISSKSSQEDEYRYNYSSNQASYYAIPFEGHQQMNYQFYYPSASPNCPIAYHQMISGYGADDHDHQGHDRHLGYYDDHRIDGRHNEVATGSMVWEQNEIDLELHL